ncbi:MAG: GCN5-related N-acetyltransferase [Myxococcota bacterium]
MSKAQTFQLAPDDASLRTRWRLLVDTQLPNAARGRRWPVHRNHCFARILLDVACRRPWRERFSPPAWRTVSPDILTDAILLGESVLRGEADLHELNRASLAMRGHPLR